jgi:hypothetical protein
MLELLLLNVRVHLRFYARNRLLLAFGVLMAGIVALSMIPMVLWDTSADHFSQLQMVTGELRGFSLVFTASLGLFAVTSHVRGRSVKLVLTKPCPPGVWLASIFLSAGVVGFALYTLIALAGLALSLVWKIPLQPGLVFTAIDGFSQAMVWLSFVTALTMAFHPVIAVMVALFFNDGMFYQLKYLIEGARVADSNRTWLLVAGFLCDGVYALLPMSHPFEHKTQTAFESWRVARTDWVVLAGACGYSLLALTFFYLLSLYLLRRKDLI